LKLGKSLTPRQALLLSIGAALLTIGLKTAAWRLTDSVAFLSDALEALVNLAAASFALAMVTWARLPADAGHPYGHGKAEYFSAAFEGALILAAALLILLAAGRRLLHPQPLGDLGLAILSVVSSVVNFAVARVLLHVGRAHRSLALIADARHLMADVWTTAGVIVGVGVASLSGREWLDPVVAGMVGVNILREGWQLLRRSVDGLMDHALLDEDVAGIEAVLGEFAARGVTYQKLRTRRAGAMRFAHVVLQLPGDWPVTRAHDLADAVEHAVASRTGVTLATHVEPLPDER
jgi:cation diffusion facilitator family transporter